MRKVFLIKSIISGYFVAALYYSYSHWLQAMNKIGLHGDEAHSMPIAIDGMAVIGMILRSPGRTNRKGETVGFSKSTNKMGLWLQMVCGTISLAVNIAAGHSPGQRIQGATFVVFYMVSELILVRVKHASEDGKAERAAAEAALVLAAEKAAAEQARIAHEADVARMAHEAEMARIQAETDAQAAADRRASAAQAQATKLERIEKAHRRGDHTSCYVKDCAKARANRDETRRIKAAARVAVTV